LGVLPGIIGTMQAAEAIKLITGIGTPLINKLLTYNVLSQEIYEVSLTASGVGLALLPKTEAAFLAMSYKDECRAIQSSVVEIDAEEFNKLRKKTSSVVIDVREKGELPLITNFDHQQIPMSVFKESVLNIKADTIILFCQHGVRSLHAAKMVHDVFGTSKEVYSLKGGVVKWGDKLGVRILNHRDREHTE
jgi:adenylyltransferase/sulfurtransferase